MSEVGCERWRCEVRRVRGGECQRWGVSEVGSVRGGGVRCECKEVVHYLPCKESPATWLK